MGPAPIGTRFFVDQFALGLAAAPLAFDMLAWRVVAAMFDRERPVTGRRG
jgi:hypothetical protein